MSSFDDSKSFRDSENISRRRKVSGLRSKTPASPTRERISKDTRRKRVWKACERCKIKKIKCDAAAPCKRCRDDDMICVAGSRKKAEFTSVPNGYAEVFENTHFSLVATVEKLYSMLRNGESWLLDEPHMKDNGMPIIHDVAKLLGCFRESPDNNWETIELRKSQDRALNAKQEKLTQSREEAVSWDHRSLSHFEQPDSLFLDSETSSSLADDVMVDNLLQEESMCQKYPSNTHQASQQQSRNLVAIAPRLDTGIGIFGYPSDQTGSLSDQFSERDFGFFDTVEATYRSPADSIIEVLDWKLWSDDLLGNSFQICGSAL